MILEQAELRDSARDLLAGTPRAQAAAAIRDAGWLALTAPEAQGGLEQPLAAAVWLYLELGRALSPAPLLPSLLAVDALAACPASAERDAWMERLAAGETMAVSLLADGGERRMLAVAGAAQASHALFIDPALVAAIPLDRVSPIPRPTWDESRELAEIDLSDIAVEENWVLGRGPEAAAAVALHLHFAIAADCVGAADALLDQTVDYLKTRRQFDRPLAMFQALKHRCADLKTAVCAAEALLMRNLDAIGASDDPLALARAAKSLASATFRAVAEESVQLHGGIGMTEEHPCHLFLKRALLNEQLASPDDACDVAVAQALLAMPG